MAGSVASRGHALPTVTLLYECYVPVTDGSFFSASWLGLDAAEATLTASLTRQPHEGTFPTMLTLSMQREQENLLGGLINIRALLHTIEGDGDTALVLFQQTLTLVPTDNLLIRSQNAMGQMMAFFMASFHRGAMR
jgi:hypothetical protein